jgi:integrase
VRGLVAYLFVATMRPAGIGYVRTCGSDWGRHFSLLHHDFAGSFHRAAVCAGFSDPEARRQWSVLARIAATAGSAPNGLSHGVFEQSARALTTAYTPASGTIPRSWSTPLHGLTATLTSLGILGAAPTTRLSPSSRSAHWTTLSTRSPLLAATLRRYLAQIAVSMRPGSVELIDTSLRHLAGYLTDHHPSVTSVAGIGRTHIEGFKTSLSSRTGYRGKPGPAKTTVAMRLGHLRGFFDRIIEWGYHDAPPRNPIFAGDIPIRDRPLPRFLDDPTAAALLAATRNLPDLFDRVAVEVLARTGLRKGEFLGLTRDAISQIGDGRWLRTPVGKLHTDRYIPLHPRVEELLQQWLTAHPPLPRSNLMFTHRGRPIPGRRLDKAVSAAAAAADIGHVTPHQLRHTLATQAINNGMSLEAIAALLGHTSMSMTMTYARISDRTVAAEYHAVSAQVEALYTPAAAVPPTPTVVEGPNMRRLRAETTRLLGNGRCNRPAILDCQYETICETCTHFTTSEEHRQTLTNQLDDATQRRHPRRQKVYLELLTKLSPPTP